LVWSHDRVDFVDWCTTVLRATRDTWDVTDRTIGLDTIEVAQRLFGSAAKSPDFDKTTRFTAISDGLEQRASIGAVHKWGPVVLWKPMRAADDILEDPLPLWTSVRNTRLTEDAERLLRIVNSRSPRSEDDHAWVGWVSQTTILNELGWATHRYWRIADRLHERQF